MKTLLFLCVAISSVSFAGFEPCNTKMKQAAVAQYARDAKIKINLIKIIAEEPGISTQVAANNTGSSKFKLGYEGETATYRVFAEQIGETRDCRITKVEKAERKFVCRGLGEEEWNVEIDLGSLTASFFDNDTTVTVPFSELRQISFQDGKWWFQIFQGKDTGGEPGTKLEIQFNEALHTAALTLGLGTRAEKTYRTTNCVRK